MKPKPRYQPGDKIGGRYKVHQVTIGGMGEVYLCLDLDDNLPYALKTLQVRHLSNLKVHKLFETEIATWVALEKHPNIVRCYKMDVFDDQPFAVLEWVAGDESKGSDLRGWVTPGPLDVRQALDFTIDICRGLNYATQKKPGLVHRDLKPDNILVSQEGVAKITDFGLSHVVQQAELEMPKMEINASGRQSLMDAGGSIVGTPPYMAPEQWRAEVPDSRTDIYAIGCIFYELLTGKMPFQATTIGRFRDQHLHSDIPQLLEHGPYTEALNPILVSCLAKRPEERFSTINNLLDFTFR